MEPLFPESCKNLSFVYDFYKDVIKRLMPERTLMQILKDTENIEVMRLNPASYVYFAHNFEFFNKYTKKPHHQTRLFC